MSADRLNQGPKLPRSGDVPFPFGKQILVADDDGYAIAVEFSGQFVNRAGRTPSRTVLDINCCTGGFGGLHPAHAGTGWRPANYTAGFPQIPSATTLESRMGRVSRFMKGCWERDAEPWLQHPVLA